MSGNDITDRRQPLFPRPRKPTYTLATFREALEAKKIPIPTGKPRFGESQFDRDVRMTATSRRLFFAEVVQSAKARLDLLGNRRGTERLPCPWARFPDHGDDCKRCKGSGYTTVVCLRTHYQRMANEYARWA